MHTSTARYLLKGKAFACAALLGLLTLLMGGKAHALDPDKAFNHYVSSTWSIQEGLPQISSLAITQDHDGYIWVGTQNGLARFDGVRFTTYTPEVEPQLPGIFIRALLVDREGQLWIGTYKGLAVYSRGQFKTLAVKGMSGTVDVNALAQLADGRIVAATNLGVFSVRQDKLVPWMGSPRPALSLLVRPDGLWVGGNGAVTRLQGSVVEKMPFGESTQGATHLTLAQGRLWMGTTKGLYFQNGKQWARYEESALLARAPINTVMPDRAGNLWVSTNSDFIRIQNTHVVETVDPHLIAVRSVISSFEDREGNLWLGSQLEGLSRIWNGWTRRYSSSVGLNDQIVWSLSPGSNGKLWVGGNNGLSLFNGKRFELIIPGDKLPHPQAYNVLAEKDRVWVGTRHGLAIWQNGHLQMPAFYAPLATAQINGIYRAPNGDVWFPTSEGLFWEHGKTLDHFGVAEGLSNPSVRLVFHTRAGRFLVGTQGGLFERKGDRFFPVPGLPGGLDVTTLSELPSGALVMGVLTESVYYFDGKKWTNIGRDEGLPNNTPFFQTVDDQGFFWIAGIRGVERVPVKDLVQFAQGKIPKVRGEMLLNEKGDRNAGQQGFCCNGAGLSKGFMKGHSLWLPSRDGVVELDMHGIVKNPVAPKVVIERLRHQDQWHTVDPSSPAPELGPAGRDIAIDFTAPSFQDPRSVRLRYRLSGYDDQWRELDDVTRRTVNYTNLPPGQYVFEVSGSNNAGVWSAQPAQLQFSILPWFYETRWFYLLLCALGAVVIYLGYLYQLHRYSRQKNLLEEQVHERTEELRQEIQERERVQEQLRHQVMHDALTGLPNRSYLRDQLQRALTQLVRTPSRPCALLFLDVDRFKLINDSLGHLAGDEVLREIARRLQSCVRAPGMVARLSGDEFAVLLEDVARPAVAAKVARRILSALAKPAHIGGAELSFSASVGIALCDARYELADDVLRDADIAMYRAKQLGRSRFEIFDESLQQIAEDVLHLERELRVALHKNQFEPYFQPIVHLNSGTVAGYEALIRWNHPTRGVLAPAHFLKVAEENGSIEDIDWKLFELACAGLARLDPHGTTYVAINVSPRHFRRKGFESRLLSMLHRTGLEPSRLLIEITEGSLIDHPELVRTTLEHLRAAGMGAALDDFGTGYSCLSYLHTLPLNTLKVDRSFVAELIQSQETAASSVVASVLALARSLEMRSVGEGIETPEQREALLALGCDYGQGYLLGRPAPVEHWVASSAGQSGPTV